jgi:hypothetical protein
LGIRRYFPVYNFFYFSQHCVQLGVYTKETKMSTAPIERLHSSILAIEETKPHLRAVPDTESNPILSGLQQYIGEAAVVFGFSVSLSPEYVGNIKVRDNLLVSLDTSMGDKQLLLTKELTGVSDELKTELGALVMPHNRRFTV